MKTPIVKLQQFIQAIRDAGYRGTGAALSELIDNAFEAGAKNVLIKIAAKPDNRDEVWTIAVADDGCGMTTNVMEAALQFGGSSRFGSRFGTGRFGMGLPNSSVSQARRVDVYSWQRRGLPFWSFLDVDQIANGRQKAIKKPIPASLPDRSLSISPRHGTVIVWSKCDRLSPRRFSALLQRLQKEIGQVFRFSLWDGRHISINGEQVRPYDPLFLRRGRNMLGAQCYGPDMEYHVRNGDSTDRAALSKILVRFVELPVEDWHSLSNEEKRLQGISKNAGVSILRAGREIDYGWYFMGGKRKENYDDWWRCEIEFQPDLDKFLGVTHTKQGINPTEQITRLLAPDLEQIAHKLNFNVRRRFMQMRPDCPTSSERIASERDAQFEPPSSAITRDLGSNESDGKNPALHRAGSTFTLGGLKYRLEVRDLPSYDFFLSQLDGARLTVTLNRQHPFFDRFYSTLRKAEQIDLAILRRQIELFIMTLGRTEVDLKTVASRTSFHRFRSNWSNLLAAFLA
jgi:hypothetical protein